LASEFYIFKHEYIFLCKKADGGVGGGYLAGWHDEWQDKIAENG
jgi:hypothetical protein